MGGVGGLLKEGGDCGNRAGIKSGEGVLRFVRALRLASTCEPADGSFPASSTAEEEDNRTGSAETTEDSDSIP